MRSSYGLLRCTKFTVSFEEHRAGPDDRFWHIPDVLGGSRKSPLSGAERTLAMKAGQQQLMA